MKIQTHSMISQHVQRWPEKVIKQGLAIAHVVRLLAARGGKTWNLIPRLDNRYLREWFKLEYLLWRIREEICRPAILEMTKHLDEYFFRLKRVTNKNR